MRPAPFTAEYLREVLVYEPATGEFEWLRSSRRAHPGRKPGSLQSNGRHQWWAIGIDGVQYRAHQLAWLHVTGAWPAHGIEHRDGDKLNNRFANLREMSESEKQHRKHSTPPNMHGYPGVKQYHNRPGKQFEARVYVKGKRLSLGTYSTAQEAGKAYAHAKAALRINADTGVLWAPLPL